MPIVLPILHNEVGAVYVDTILFGSDMVSVLFSFTRSYFLVDVSIPAQCVLFLQQLMPAKPISEIYSCDGTQQARQNLLLPLCIPAHAAAPVTSSISHPASRAW